MPSADKSNSALLVLAHGSTENPDSSTPAWEHANRLKSSGAFASVHCAFWKEEPGFRNVWSSIEEEEVYVVPLFVSEGWMTREVIPRELGLSGHTTQRGRHTVHYCDPVGSHDSMTDLLLNRAHNAVGDSVSAADTSLLIVGHGTPRNRKSSESIRKQVERIQNTDHAAELTFAEVGEAFMEESPYVADWSKLTRSPNVVVVPFFISDGLHSYQDIPVLLGIESDVGEAASRRDVFRHNPHDMDGRKLYYTSAIGSDPAISQVILDQIDSFDELYRR